MSSASSTPTLPDLDAARAQVGTLEALLQQEFDVLRARSFEELDRLQSEKLAILESLQSTANQVAGLPQPPEAWAGILEALQACRNAYRRNELLVIRQLEVVRTALSSLQAADPTATVDLYDRMGQMARRGARRVHTDA